MTVLEVKNITRTYRKNGIVIPALKDISFSLEKGEILGIVGESGCGKSTLLKQIAGVETPDAGEIYLNGAKLKPVYRKNRKERYRQMQMVFQNAAESFNPRRWMAASMRENLKFLSGISDKKEQMRIIGFYMDKVGLKEELALRHPGEVSGGQCQRAAIARAVMTNPDLLLCDEITSALDVIVQDRIAKLIRGLAKELDIAVVFVSHDIALVGSLCDRMIVMLDGECVEQGETGQILAAPQCNYTKLLLDSVLEP